MAKKRKKRGGPIARATYRSTYTFTPTSTSTSTAGMTVIPAIDEINLPVSSYPSIFSRIVLERFRFAGSIRICTRNPLKIWPTSD